MINIKNTYKHIYLLIFVLSGGTGTTNAAVQQSSNQVVDQSASQWANRDDVKAAVKELFAVHEKLDAFVQNIFNAYAPHTSGTSHEMRNRIKDLARLVTAAGNVEGIYINYFYTTKATRSHKANMESSLNSFLLYYYNQELKQILNVRSSILQELKSSIQYLRKHTDFITHTNFNQVEFDNLVTRIDKAIKAAMATIPGGLAAIDAS
jgi:hypothetical protein